MRLGPGDEVGRARAGHNIDLGGLSSEVARCFSPLVCNGLFAQSPMRAEASRYVPADEVNVTAYSAG